MLQLWSEMLAVDLTGSFLVTRAVASEMLARRAGRIVNIASTAGLSGYPYVSAYCAAKHGLVGLTRALALEFARKGVTVNAVCPGYTDTPMLDAAIAGIAAKTGRGEEDARATLAAANPSGRLVTPAGSRRCGALAGLARRRCGHRPGDRGGRRRSDGGIGAEHDLADERRAAEPSRTISRGISASQAPERRPRRHHHARPAGEEESR